jgi:putative membrane protein
MATRRSADATAPPSADRGAVLAEERTLLAAERTLMAWIRTSLSMISFGFTMVKLFEYLEHQGTRLVGPFGRVWGPAAIGFTLVAIGVFALVAALVQHRRTLRMLHAQGLAPRWSLGLTVGVLLALLGVFAFGSLALRY